MNSQKILVVDDDPMIFKITENMLGESYEVIGVSSGKEAIDFMRQNDVCMILLDIYFEDMHGFDIFSKIKSLPGRDETPVIFLTSDTDTEIEKKGIDMGALDFIRKPFVPEIVTSRVLRCIENRHHHILIEEEVKVKTSELEKQKKLLETFSSEIINALVSTIDARDTYTKGHSKSVAEYSLILARAVGFNDEELMNLKYMALLHDIGKIGIPDMVLNKPGRLTEAEFNIIKSHTVIGSEILKDVTALEDTYRVARHHHERYDGLGYPDGLKGEDIPLAARIVGIADAFDAMTSDRIYRSALSEETVLRELKKGKETQFDPRLLEVFLRLYKDNQLKLKDDNNDFKQSKLKEFIDKLAKELYETAYGINTKLSDIHDIIKKLDYDVGEKFSIVLFAFKSDNTEAIDSKKIANAVKAMEYGINSAIKNGDTYKVIGEDKLLVLLFESKSEDAGNVVDKIMTCYYRNMFDTDFRPTYKIVDIGNEKESRKTVMVVDDNSMNLRIAEFALKSKYEVIKVNAGDVALEVLPGNHVDLILLDILMPDMSGFETFEEIRKLDGFVDTPICFLTAELSDDSLETMRKLGAPYVKKPFEVNDLLNTVSELLGE